MNSLGYEVIGLNLSLSIISSSVEFGLVKL